MKSAQEVNFAVVSLKEQLKELYNQTFSNDFQFFKSIRKVKKFTPFLRVSYCGNNVLKMTLNTIL